MRRDEKKGDELSKFADCPQIHRRPQLLVVLIRSLAMQSPTSGRRQRRRLHKLFAERDDLSVVEHTTSYKL